MFPSTIIPRSHLVASLFPRRRVTGRPVGRHGPCRLRVAPEAAATLRHGRGATPGGGGALHVGAGGRVRLHVVEVLGRSWGGNRLVRSPW